MTQVGIDVLAAEARRGASALRLARIGLVTNPSAVTATGECSWEVLLGAGFRIAAFFGPEHGFRGDAQADVAVADGEYRGIPSYSLYGARRTPEPWMLEGLDAIVFDIQDVGCRYYTYLYTLANIARACELARLPLTVLDRPNPLGGVEVEGSPLPEDESSFVGGYRLPPRYGLTIGEYARYLRGEFFPALQLEVVAMEGWSRSTRFAETLMPWVNPSPNIPGVATALAYPGTCLLEGTNLSEGRGTTRPFEFFGAPWIDGNALRARLAELDLPGVRFAAAAFEPGYSKHAGSACGGAMIDIVDEGAFKPLLAGIAILKTLRDLEPGRFAWLSHERNPGGPRRYAIDNLAGGGELRELIDAEAPLARIYGWATAGEDGFRRSRSPYLLY